MLSLSCKREETVGKGVILVIHEDDNFVKKIKDSFPEEFEIYTASSSKEGYELSLKLIPDVVLSNTSSPEIDGWALIKQLKEENKTSHIPFIFLSEEKGVSPRIKAFELGAYDYITKPFDLDELRARVEIALRRSKRVDTTPPPERKNISGKLGQMSLADILQILGMNRKTCTVTLEKGGVKGKIFFEHGKILHAYVGNIEGEKAVHLLLRWQDADFLIEDGITAIFDVTIGKDPQSLLLDGMTQSDEERRKKGEELLEDFLFPESGDNTEVIRALEKLEAMGLIKRVEG